MPEILPRHFCLLIVTVSLAALVSVLIGQYGFGLHPCHLCMYQRWPFGVAIVFGMIGFLLPRLSKLTIGLSSLTFLINAGIALYHSGVERKWWRGLEGCSTPDMSGSIEDLMQRIQSTAVVRCDEIAFKIFGMSLANINVFYCLICAFFCAIYLLKSHRAARS